MAEILLEAQHLKKHFPVTTGHVLKRETGLVKAVDGVGFRICRGETLGLVGESGCGKSTLANLILLLEPATSGTIQFEGRDISQLTGKDLRLYKSKVQAVFQDPYSSLNPRMKIRNLLAEPILASGRWNKARRAERIVELLDLVGLKERDVNLYPHEFSGGQRQRIAIARSLGPQPELIVLDEPVSALDVSIRSQIMNLLRKLQKQFNLTYLLIAHDLGVVQHMSDWVAVMYLGKIVELARSEQLYATPMHPYTRALIAAATITGTAAVPAGSTLSGDIPSPLDVPAGCRLHTRCPLATEICRQTEPEFEERETDHRVACHHC